MLWNAWMDCTSQNGGVIEAFVEIRTDVVVAQVVYGDIRAAV